MEYITKNAKETEKLGETLAREVKGSKVIALIGDLGGGKTTFIKGFARGLGIKHNITSPSFLIMREYPVDKKNIKKLYHFDAYKIKDPREFLDLGFNEVLKEKEKIILIEWADRVKKILPKEYLTIKFEFLGKKKRKVTFKSSP